MNIAILGGGITGLTLGSKLLEKGISFTIFEKNERVGGLCKTDLINDYVFDLHGGHVFNSKYKDVVEWAFKKFSREKWVHTSRYAQIRYGNQLLDYPFEFSLAQLPPEEAVSCIMDFFSDRGEKPTNYHDWIIWMFGRSIAEKYMLPYNEKIWQYDLRKMAIDWVDGKMPLPTKEEVLRAALKMNAHESKMPHSSYFYPVIGGIESFIKEISPTEHILTSFEITEISNISGKWTINGHGPFDRIVWTIPLPCVTKYLSPPGNVALAAKSLKWNSITTYLYSSECQNNSSWTYFPEKKYPYHRVVNQGGLSPKACPGIHGSFTVEMIGEHSPDELDQFFDQELLIGSSHTEFAYVLFDKDHAKNAELVKNYMESVGIIPLGRFGEWQYYNMDICMKRAFDCAESLPINQ